MKSPTAASPTSERRGTRVDCLVLPAMGGTLGSLYCRPFAASRYARGAVRPETPDLLLRLRGYADVEQHY